MSNYESKFIKSIDGLMVFLDKLICEHNKEVPEGGCAYVYFLTVSNLSDRTVTLLGRKWVLRTVSNEVSIVEGERIVSQMPTLFPGESFCYNSYHVILETTIACGVLYGIDEYDEPIHIVVPRFEMKMRNNEDLKKQDEIRGSQ